MRDVDGHADPPCHILLHCTSGSLQALTPARAGIATKSPRAFTTLPAAESDERAAVLAAADGCSSDCAVGSVVPMDHRRGIGSSGRRRRNRPVSWRTAQPNGCRRIRRHCHGNRWIAHPRPSTLCCPSEVPEYMTGLGAGCRCWNPSALGSRGRRALLVGVL